MDIESSTTAFAALSQDTRLRVFRLLLRAGADGMLAGEIGQALGTRQNTMSTNLAILERAGLIRGTREGRAIRYTADFDGLRGMLAFLMQDCCGGNALRCQPVIDGLVAAMEGPKPMPNTPYNVLFLCTGNSARSIMAEAILNRAGKGHFRAYSAGSTPAGQVHPQALQILEKLNIPTEGLHSKAWDVFAGHEAPQMDFVFTVCDHAAAEPCPVWPGQPMSAHWGVPDPVQANGSPAELGVAFAEAFRMLESRINVFTSLPLAGLDALSLKKHLDDIGKP
ncbi:helix-turn-helix domain-containing protein [Pseudoruegeria sp. SHC-113]|uniref:arsenate reductase/protein-tyrosine-phosphatase family protein n=1 Tax=Pseudoruegeria sp. SHC-113 TaxID=2855439 RepID=UPI0021BB01E2|nr:helix-turn-helix domain-containing protein [Pseudoruegeria sp. SHC-113]MCT8162007.1 helix-turn-helix domain-containing protein [Pseudoruegeria sp. SHC-113]